MRSTNATLGVGELVPLRANDLSVVAYVRRAGANAVPVIANLGASAAANVVIDSDSRLLRSGHYSVNALLPDTDSAAFAPLRVESRGAIRGYRPAGILPARNRVHTQADW